MVLRRMDAREFLGLEATHNPHRWVLPIEPRVCTGGNFLFGGCGLGAAIAALEGTTDRPVVWAAAQYLSYARPPEVMDVDVTIAVGGNKTTQGAGRRPRGRPRDPDGQRRARPSRAGQRRPVGADARRAVPAECEPRRFRNPNDDSIMQRLDMRLALGQDFADFDGTPGTGRSALWARLPDGLEMSAATLAILGDYVPFGVGQALGQMAGGNSLDNTLRVSRLVPTEWVLLDIQVHAIQHGFGHGLVHLWAEDGTLLAIASQSCIVRYWREEHRAAFLAAKED